MTRPSFDSIPQSKMNKVKHIDFVTGLPLHSNIFEEKFDITKRDIQYQKSLPDNIEKIKLKTDGKLHRTACIILDVILSLQSVQCLFDSQQKLILTFDSIANAIFIYNKWIISDVQFVNGGKEWGCRNVTTHEPILIIQRIISFRIKNKNIIFHTVKDMNLSPLVCFTNITLSLTIEQSNLATQILSRKKRTISDLKFFSDSWYLIPKVPRGGEIFYPGQTINIQWSYLNIDETNRLIIILNRKRFGLNSQISQLNTYINIKNISFTIPLLLNISSHDEYYFEFDFYHKFSSYKKTSEIFYITREPLIIPGSLPLENDIYFPGDSIKILWESINFEKTSKIIVRFRRIEISIDPILDMFSVLATTNNYIYNIMLSLNRSDNDKYYYFEFDYCTFSTSTNCKTKTNKFLVPTRPYIHVTYPVGDNWFLPLEKLNLKWINANFDNKNDLLIIKLFHYNYLLSDNEIDQFSCLVNSSGSCFYILPDVDSSFSDYYFQFNWCRYWYSTQCTTKSNRFFISKHVIRSWNYDQYRGKALESKELVSTNCTSLCPTQNSKFDYICQMCDEGRSLGIQLTCINCWAIYDYSLIQIDLVRKDNSPALDYLSVRIHSSISVNIDFSVSANYNDRFHGNLFLPSIPIIKPVPFKIANIPFDLSMIFESSIPWVIELDTIENFTAGIDYQLETNLTLIINDKNTRKNFNQILKRNNHPIEGNFQSNIKIDLAYRPVFKLIITILTIELSTEGFLIFEAKWNYPPFDSLQKSTFNWYKEKISAIHLSIPPDACISPHFIRYHTMIGIRKSKISFLIYTIHALNKYFNKSKMFYSTPSLFDLGPFELSSGCIYKAQRNKDISQKIFFVLNRQFNQTNDSLDLYLSKSIVSDLSYALNVSSIRFYYNSSFGIKHNQMTVVIIIVLPSSSNFTVDLTVFKLIEILKIQEKDIHSPLYSGSITRFTNADDTRKANRRK
ncbi:unnamed protein product [Rotaria sordida]|uniref:Uncharacterized protein n=1 Tax=Rotaria sordida TaxID=392033 RepID=A0A819S3V4_9BILA|nr:unnamed protein product [Rotaria sordida]CAF4063637.1 unnamed protein product [Rotaria sordida]